MRAKPAGARPVVAFVSMPFAVCAMPSIALGLLKARLAEAGLDSTVYDFNLELLPVIDSDLRRAAGASVNGMARSVKLTRDSMQRAAA